MDCIFYRIADDAGAGLWYDCNGNFTGLIHGKYNFCKNNSLQMPFDAEVENYLSATDSLFELYQWFPKEDILKLQTFGYKIRVYKCLSYKYYKNHWLIKKTSSLLIDTIVL